MLLRIDGGGYSNILIDSLMQSGELPEGERALAAYLVRGVTERRITLDYIIARLASRPLAKTDPDTKNILRLGIYQLAYCDRIPAHAAVNETVALARQSSRGFVNAILRAYQRTVAEGEFPFPEKGGKNKTARYLSVRYSVNEPLCRELLAAYGESRTENMLRAFLEPPPLTLRVNTARTGRDGLCRELEAAGFAAEPTDASPWGIRTSGAGLPACLTGDTPTAFAEDEAAQLAVWVLDPRAGERVLDACAAPGTKSISAALEMEDRGEIVACELHKNRLPLIEKSAARQGVTIIRAVCRDSSAPWEGEKFDCVLCDVPCSAMGVVKKQPDVLLNRNENDISALKKVQYSILDNAKNYVKRGGLLVYSTCTIFKEENDDNVEEFLKNNKDFEKYPSEFDGQYLPCDTHDGFFIRRLRRK